MTAVLCGPSGFASSSSAPGCVFDKIWLIIYSNLLNNTDVIILFI